MLRDDTPNRDIPIIRKDIIAIVASYLSLQEYARLKQTCHVANVNGNAYEHNMLMNPAMLLQLLIHLKKDNIGKLLQRYFWYQPEREAHFLHRVTTDADCRPALAAYALFAPRAKINLYAVTIHETIAWLLGKNVPANSTLILSLSFLISNHIENKERISEILINLRGAALIGKNFSNLDLSYANFSEADLTNAHFEISSLYCANLSGATLRSTNFHAASLSHADLRGSHCTFATFIGASLYHANLGNANMRHALLRNWSPAWLCCGSYYQFNHYEEDNDSAILNEAKYNTGTRLPLFFAKRLHKMLLIEENPVNHLSLQL